MRTETGPRAEASKRTREAIVAATVRIVAREGVAAVSHRRVAAEAGVALSSTTWHFAAKADILEAALRWTASREVERIRAIADHLGDSDFDPSAWAEELGEWLVEQVTGEREVAVALYRLQVELLGSAGALQVHARVGRGTAHGRRAACSRTPRRRRPSSTCASSSQRSTASGWACSTRVSRTSSGCAWPCAGRCGRCSADNCEAHRSAADGPDALRVPTALGRPDRRAVARPGSR